MPVLPALRKHRARHAFIAAPLLGAIIFLACILFVVNLNKAEAAETARIVNDAYHNRIVSLLEVYRTDLETLFRAGLSYNIENLLAKQNWYNLFRFSNAIGAYYQQEDCDLVGEKDDSKACAKYHDEDHERISLTESRFQACRRVSSIIHEIICSIPQSAGATCESACSDYTQQPPKVGDCSNPIDTPDCRECCSEDKSYGLPRWIGYLNKTIAFEGITFSPANPEQFGIFLNPQGYPDGWRQYEDKCKKLLNGSVFDCDKFAEGPYEATAKPFRCCDASLADDPNKCDVEDEEVISGCEPGIFFVKVSLTNPDVYPIMPRILADDGVGNQIRSGSVGEEDFYLPINYPLFKYYQYAFAFYKRVAYNERENPHSQGVDEGREEGIADGHCLGGSNCADMQHLQEFGGDQGYGSPAATDEGAKKTASENFFKIFKKGCEETVSQIFNYGAPVPPGRMPPPDDDINHQVCDVESLKCKLPGGDESGWKDCTTVNAYDDPNAGLKDDLEADSRQCGDPQNEGYCGFYVGKSFNMRIVDYSPVYQIDPENHNVFAWWAAPFHDDCANWDQHKGVCE